MKAFLSIFTKELIGRFSPARNPFHAGGIFLCLILLATSPAEAATVRGQVMDSKNGIFLQGARISVEGMDIAVFSERGGNYVIRNLKPGTYTLNASSAGYGLRSAGFVLKDSDSTATVMIDFTEGDLEELEEFTVKGSAVGQARAINIQRSADNLMNVVASDAIGKFVDRNAAEALQRLPGISIENSQGEGKFVIIRGADPSLNSVSIDGVNSATTEADGRTTALNIISIEQLESIEVTKTWLPDHWANFIGGSVNLITRSALDRGSRFTTLEVAGGQHKISDAKSSRVAVTYGDVLGKKKNIGIQFSFDSSNDNRGSDTLKTRGFFTQAQPDVRKAPLGFQLEGLQLDDFVIKRQRTGVSGKFEYKLNDNNRFNFTASVNNFDDDEVLQETQQNVSLGGSSFSGKTVFDEDVALAIGLDPNDPEVAARLSLPPEKRPILFDESVAIGDLAFDPVTKMFTRQHNTTSGKKSWRSDLTNDEIRTFQGGGKHHLFNFLDLDYKIFRSSADKTSKEQRLNLDSPNFDAFSGVLEPDNIPFVTENGVISQDPSSFQLNDDRGSFQDNLFLSTDKRSGFEVNLELQYNFLGLKWKTKFGFGKDSRDKTFDRDFNSFSQIRTPQTLDQLTLADDVFDGGILDGFIEDFGDGMFAFGPRFDTDKARAFIKNPGDIEFVTTRNDVTLAVTDAISKNFSATEDITAAYLMQTVNVKGFTIIAGFRFERTKNTFTINQIEPRSENLPRSVPFASPGFWKPLIDNLGEESFISSFTSARETTRALPAFHVIKRFSDKAVIRAAYTETIARPKFTDLVPREIVDVDGALFGNKVRLPNFDLQAQGSKNFDFSFERYSGRVGFFSFNFFYKKLDGPIFKEARNIPPGTGIAPILSAKYTSDGLDVVEWRTTKMSNAGGGEIRGFEFAFERKFDFLPSPFDGFGMSFNGTIVSSSVQLLLEERLNEEVPLFKQSDRLANLSFFYEKYGFLARLTFNWRGGFLDNVQAGRERIDEITNENKIGLDPNSLDVYVDDFFKVDLRLEYKIRKRITLFFEGTNINNAPEKKFFGPDKLRLKSIQFTKPILFVGFKWHL